MKNKLTEFLQAHLTAADYLEAKTLLETALRDTEEQGFEAGCKYMSQLAGELIFGRCSDDE